MTVLLTTEHSFPIRCQGPDQTHQNCFDGNSSDEGARERPRDAGGLAVQSRQILRQHARAAQDLARQHGPNPREERRLIRGLLLLRLSYKN